MKRLLLGFLLSAVLSGVALAQHFPNRPIRLVVGFSAGGAVDLTARIVAERLSKELGQPIIVDNRPGASGLLAATNVSKSEPDGYTLLFSSNGALTINIQIVDKPPYDPLTAFAPIARIARVDGVIVVAPDFPAKDFNEFLKLIRSSPGKYSFASSGLGGPTHLVGELLKKEAGLDLLHIPYAGDAPALNDVLGGTVPIAISVIPSADQFLKAGRLRMIASLGERRLSEFQNVPTVAESGFPKVVGGAWYAVLAPAKTPAPVISILSDSISRVMTDPAVMRRLEAIGVEPAFTPSKELSTYIEDELEKWRQVINYSIDPAGIK